MPPPARDELVHVVGERDRPARLQVDVREPAARLRGPSLDVVEEDVGVLRHERGAQPAVGQPAGHLQALRAERGEIDRNARLGRRPRRRSALPSPPGRGSS